MKMSMLDKAELSPTLKTYRTAASPTLDLYCAMRISMLDEAKLSPTLNTYRTAVSPTLDLLCHEDFNVLQSGAESNIKHL